MKQKSILIVLMLLFNSVMYAQLPELPKINSQLPVFNVYQNVNGLTSVFPSKTIIYNNGNYDIYRNTNGLRDVFPSKIVELKINGNYDVYDVKNGLKSIFPTETLKPPNNYNYNNQNVIENNLLIKNLYNNNYFKE